MLDTQIEIQENQHLSLEDALDLMLCMSYNAFNSEIKERYNPYKLHFDQRLAKGVLGFYVWTKKYHYSEHMNAYHRPHKLFYFKT